MEPEQLAQPISTEREPTRDLQKMKQIDPTSLRILIDKLGISVSAPRDVDASAEHIERRVHELFKARRARPCFGHGRRYQLRYLLELRRGKFALVEAVPLQSSRVRAFLRIEFNPNKVGEKGIERAKQHLQTLLLDDFESLMTDAEFTCLHTAVDLPADIEHLLVTTAGKSHSAVWGKAMNGQGRIESIYHGAAASDSRITAYDKIEELTAALIRTGDRLTLKRARRKIGVDGPLTRIESRDKNLGIRVADFRQIPNRFAKIRIAHFPGSEKPFDTPVGRMFLDSVRFRGAAAALRLLDDDDLRKQFSRAIEKRDVGWWRPEELWSQLPKRLSALGLFPTLEERRKSHSDSEYKRVGPTAYKPQKQIPDDPRWAEYLSDI